MRCRRDARCYIFVSIAIRADNRPALGCRGRVGVSGVGTVTIEAGGNGTSDRTVDQAAQLTRSQFLERIALNLMYPLTTYSKPIGNLP